MEKHPNQEKIIDTAYHEAGHVFAYYKLKIPFRYVTIIPNGKSYGHVEMDRRYSKPFDRMLHSEHIRLEHVINNLMKKCAGNTSNKIYNGKNDVSSSDTENIDEFLSFPGIVAETGAFIKWIELETENMLKWNWKKVELIAKELLIKKKLKRKEIELLMKKHHLELIS